ncbi:Phosphatidylinositol-3-phosphatase SAC1 [Paraconiothyrium brasiliense]|uniref:Phosphatidylinositol-3-phosphatase SAC1 n=1 Tax=Paraconiothyrium brasiliense TaxID=300254 RepID=A0ABR3R381_9PLEO
MEVENFLDNVAKEIEDEQKRKVKTDGRRRTPTPEPTEDDRDKRTIFVQQISQRAEMRHLRAFFEAVGPVVEAQIVKDRVTGRSKGVGYVEFKDEESVPKALELTGQKLKGVPIIAQLTEAEKNRASRAAGEGGAASATNGAPFHRLYVGNIHFSVTEEDLKEIFLPFGELEQVTLQRDEQNPTRSKGYGFVQFVDPNDAKKALTEMNGFELAGRQIRVGLGNDKFTPESTAHLLRNFPQQAASYQGSAFSGAGGRGAYAGGSGGVFDRAHGRDDRGISGASALDDTDMAGVNFKQVDRNKLMMNLARNEVDVPTKKDDRPIAKARAPVENTIAPSKCIKIQNAFDADQELNQFGPNWAKDLETEVKTECNSKYGNVVHIAVDANSDGEIFVKFDSVSGGEKALQGLNGRNFNYRTIRASYVVDKVYNSLYGAAAAF